MLVAVPQEIVKEFEAKLADIGVEIVKTGRTWFDDLHYQVEADMTPEELHYAFKPIDEWLWSLNIPMTWSIGLDDRGVTTAGLDLRKQWVPDDEDEVNGCDTMNVSSGCQTCRRKRGSVKSSKDPRMGSVEDFLDEMIKTRNPEEVYRKAQGNPNADKAFKRYRDIQRGKVKLADADIENSCKGVKSAINPTSETDYDYIPNWFKSLFEESKAVSSNPGARKRWIREQAGAHIDDIDSWYNRAERAFTSKTDDRDPGYTQVIESAKNIRARMTKSSKHAVEAGFDPRWELLNTPQDSGARNRYYARCVKELDEDVRLLKEAYATGDVAPAIFLMNCGYEPLTDDLYMRRDGPYQLRIDFLEYEEEDGPISYYVLDETAQIPQGWTVSKTMLD